MFLSCLDPQSAGGRQAAGGEKKFGTRFRFENVTASVVAGIIFFVVCFFFNEMVATMPGGMSSGAHVLKL